MQNRPFENIQEMNQILIQNYNAVVHKNDTVYILGDISHHLPMDSLRGNYGKHIRIFKTVIPVAITAAESSAAGQSIYEYDKNGTVAKAYTEFTREVIQCGEKQRNKHESSLSR